MVLGGDLEPGTLLAAYRSGLFPMPLRPLPLRRRSSIGWWSPDPRAVLPAGGFHTSRSLRRSLPRFEVRIDAAFPEVVRACGDPSRPHGWINDDIVEAYTRLHELGWAHSVEAWADGQLAGGLYGVAIGALFAGESMFHRRTDASKVAVRATAELLADVPASVFDVQWSTPHLASLGVVEIPRDEYLDRLAAAVAAPGPDWADPPGPAVHP